jgi:hypothetical protein
MALVRHLPPLSLHLHGAAHNCQVACALRLDQLSPATLTEIRQTKRMVAEEIIMAFRQLQRLVKGSVRVALLGLHEERINQVDQGGAVIRVTRLSSKIFSLLECGNGAGDPLVIVICYGLLQAEIRALPQLPEAGRHGPGLPVHS